MTCGWFGLLIGYTFNLMYIISWPLLFLFFLVRLILGLKMRNITVLNLILIFICIIVGYIGYKGRPFLDGFEWRLKSEYTNMAEIQMWASETLNNAKRDDYDIDGSAYPNWVTIPGFPRPFITVINDENLGNNGYIKVGWGSGVVGQWGLEIGRPTLQKKYQKWAAGVYFYVGQ